MSALSVVGHFAGPTTCRVSESRWLSSTITALLLSPELLRRSGRPVPGTLVSQPRISFKRVLKAAGIEDFRIHDLRHANTANTARYARLTGTDG